MITFQLKFQQDNLDSLQIFSLFRCMTRLFLFAALRPRLAWTNSQDTKVNK